MKINITQYKKIVVLTGAGISVASGLGTYRGQNSNQKSADIIYSGHADRLNDDPQELWNFYAPLREQISIAEPNEAHRLLCQMEQAATKEGHEFIVLTQNVDGLHQKSGSKNVVELHGNLSRSRCSNDDCSSTTFKDNKNHKTLPPCQICDAFVRPDIVLFGEKLPIEAEWKMKKSMRNCDLFIAIGTSGTVSPASNLVRSADYEGARTVLINLEPMTPKNPYFKEEFLGKAEDVIAQLFTF